MTSTASILSSPDIPALREQLAVLVSTGKAKEAIGVQFTYEQVKLLSDKDLEKYCKRYLFNSIFNQGIQFGRASLNGILNTTQNKDMCMSQTRAQRQLKP